MEQIANRRGWAMGLVLVCALLSYHNVLWHSFHYDDEHSILENPHVRSLANVPRFFVDPGTFSGMPEARMYRPLLLATYAGNYALGGYAPMGWHAVNLLLHLVNAGLLLSLAPALGASRRAALIAGMLFAVHPVLSESVNYVSSRSSLLATCCLLLAFKGVGAVIQGRHRAWLLVAGTYLGALMAKSVAIVFPPILALFMGLNRRWHKKGLLGLTLLSGFYVVGTKAEGNRPIANQQTPKTSSIRWRPIAHNKAIERRNNPENSTGGEKKLSATANCGSTLNPTGKAAFDT